jgi:transcriptional regulator with XRE-family HTH domain
MLVLDNPQPAQYRIGMSRLRRARDTADLSQEELAAASGISQVQISRIERGKRRLTKPAARKLAAALKIRPSDLLPEMAIDELRDDLDPVELETWIRYGRFPTWY